MRIRLFIPALLLASSSLFAQDSYNETPEKTEKKPTLTNEVGFILSCIAGITFVTIMVLSKKKK